MSRLTSEKFLLNANKTISGRCRLAGVQFVLEDPSGGINATTGDQASSPYPLVKRNFEFLNGSASGSTLFKFSLPVGRTDEYGAGCTVYTFMFGESRILFPDGIFVKALTGASTADPGPAKTRMIVYYEAG